MNKIHSAYLQKIGEFAPHAVQALKACFEENKTADALVLLNRLLNDFIKELPIQRHIESQKSHEQPLPFRLLHACMAYCLHLDHQYEAAEAHIQEGLGENAALIRVPQLINTEAQYKALWADQFDKPTISICCTAYNHERTIADTLKGFLSQQTKFPFEILIHDDASTDHTQRIIKQWQQQYPHIIKPIYQTQNQYSQGKRPLDLLLKKARGKYIALCEGDDYWISPQKLEIQVDLLQKQPDFVCVGHSFYQLEEFDLKVFPFEHHQQLMVLEAEELMAVKRLFWINALVFRKDFDEFPPERKTVPLGDQFITSFLGNFGKGLYLDQFIGSVARRNPFSVWTPLSQQEKNKQRFITKLALAKMHNRMGHIGAVDQILSSIEKSVA